MACESQKGRRNRNDEESVVVLMPYKKAKYRHLRRADPDEFIKSTFRTVPISHTRTTKKYPKGTQAIVGKRKKSKKWGIQSVLIPK